MRCLTRERLARRKVDLSKLAVCVAAIFLLIVWVIPARATIFINDAVMGPDPVYFDDPSWTAITLQSISGTPGAGLFFIQIQTLSPTLFSLNCGGIAEAYSLYATTVGSSFDATAAASTTPIISNVSQFTDYLTLPLNQSKYFAYWNENLAAPIASFPTPADNYGWLEVTNTANGLVLNSSVTAQGGGIVVGTTTQVPEPASAMLMLLGAAGIAIRRGRRTF